MKQIGLHEKEAYRLSSSGQLIADCKGGPSGIKVDPQLQTAAEHYLHQALLRVQSLEQALLKPLAKTPPTEDETPEPGIDKTPDAPESTTAGEDTTANENQD